MWGGVWGVGRAVWGVGCGLWVVGCGLGSSGVELHARSTRPSRSAGNITTTLSGISEVHRVVSSVGFGGWGRTGGATTLRGPWV